MKKVVIHKPGGYRQLKIRECPPPIPKPNDVLVAVSAAGVNFADVIIRMGLYRSAKTYVGWPITPGFEFSGRVAQRGAEVSDLTIGAPVFGVTRFGAYASHVCVSGSKFSRSRRVPPLPSKIGPPFQRPS